MYGVAPADPARARTAAASDAGTATGTVPPRPDRRAGRGRSVGSPSGGTAPPAVPSPSTPRQYASRAACRPAQRRRLPRRRVGVLQRRRGSGSPPSTAAA